MAQSHDCRIRRKAGEQVYKVCFVTTISLTLKSFVVELAKAMHATGDFEIHFICDLDESSSGSSAFPCDCSKEVSGSRIKGSSLQR